MTWMQTRHRKQVDLLDPDPRTITLFDIVDALSRICRYNGHTRTHYSVAEHCCHVADYLSRTAPEHAFAGLMHDASEAYVGDLTYPMQMALGEIARGEVRAMHSRVWTAIALRFRLVGVDIHHPAVRDADRRILLDECEALLGGPVAPWSVEGEPLGVRIEGWDADKARKEWTDRWVALRHPEGLRLTEVPDAR